MPTRRPSASAGHGSSHPPSSTSRAHRNNDSQGFGPSQPPSIAYSATSATPQQKIVQALINRLKGKLPCNSGLSLDYIEADDATMRAVEALVQLSHDSLDIIAWSLSELLERLAKQTDAQGHLSVEVLQSQLFVLKVLSLAMAARNRSRQEDIILTGKSTSLPPSARSTSSFSEKQSREGSTSSSKLPKQSEPSPLDDNCARWILSVMVLYLRQTTPPDATSTSTSILSLDSPSYYLESVEVPPTVPAFEAYIQGRPMSPQSELPKALHVKHSAGSVSSRVTAPNTLITSAPQSTEFIKTHMSLVKSSLSLNNHIGKSAGYIIFQLSLSNWTAVFNRIRNKVHYLSSTSEDNPDTVDLQLMTHSALDRLRLVQVLQVLSSLLVNMRREAQAAVAVPLRKAVWNWISNCPGEFNDALRSRGRMEGAPERTFDLLFSMQQGSEKSFWPTLTILNCISSERLSSDFQVSGFGTGHLSGQKSRKDHRFLEDIIKHANGNSKFNEVALVCTLDMCRVAFRVSPNEGEIPLRLIGSDIAHELKIYLHKTHKGKPFWESGDEIDVPLFGESLATVFRFLPEEESIPLFVTCLEPERSEAVKMVAARAIFVLANEASKLSWQRPLTNLSRATARRFRNVYRAAASRRNELDQYNNIKKAASRPKAKRFAVDAVSDRELLLLGILSMWRQDMGPWAETLDVPEATDWLTGSVRLWDANIDISVKISAAASFQSLNEAVIHMLPTDPFFDLFVGFQQHAAPSTLLSVVMNLLNARSDIEAQRLWINTAYQTVKFYSQSSEAPHVRSIQLFSERVPAFALAEIAFLVSLTSADKGVSQLAAQGLRHIAKAEQQPGSPNNPGVTMEERSRRHSIYEQIGDPNVIVVGRVGQQKRLRKLVRSIARPAPSYIAVWEECYWRWRSLCEFVVQSPLDPIVSPESHMQHDDPSMSTEEKHVQWRNLTLFLAAFGGACVQDFHDPAALLTIIPAQYLPDEMRVLQNPMNMVSTFITDLTDLLIAESAQVREVARDALGSELSPRLYAKLFRHLDEVTREVTDGANHDLSESFGTFLDQFTVVLKLLLEKSDVPADEVEHIDISTTLVALAGFIARFNNPLSYRIRLKLCALCDCVCERTETLTLRRDTNARHLIIDILMEWIQDPHIIADGDSARDQINLNMACLRTAVKLLDQLDLTLQDETMGNDIGHTVSRLFIRYSNILLKGLDFCQTDHLTSDSRSDVQSLQMRTRISQREAELRELVITGLSHLVTANAESGFKHCLLLAYNQDPRKRTIFARVFARVLSQGTKFQQVDPADADKPSRLCELVQADDMLLALAICDVCPSSEVDVIISVLMNLYDTRTSLVKLLKFMIDREILHTESEASLFRSNSTTTRFLSAFAKIHGYNYLRTLILPLMKTMTSMPPGQGYELDPNKALGQDVEQNQENVKTVASAFLDVISSSIPIMPPMFREICAYIAKSVIEVWPEAKFAALGAFIFLRFISPAVVAPEVVDIEVPKDDGGTMRRGLMVIAKVIQNLANNIFFGKEAHMVPLNEFLGDHIVKVTRFLNDIVKTQEQSADEDEADEWLGTTADDTDTIVLHRFFDKHIDKIGKELLSHGKTSNEDDDSHDGKKVWSDLCAALIDIGEPVEVPQLSSESRSEHLGYTELMTRLTHRNTDELRSIFVETSMPEDQPAIFIIRVCNVDVDALDVELFMYHIFKTLEKPAYQDRLFEIILDCTSFTSISEIPVHWIKYCTELIPSDVRRRFLTTYILNPNNQTQRYLRRLYNISAGVPFSNGVRAYSSVEELLEHVPAECASSLSYARALEEERSEVFTEVTMRQSHQMRMPITLEVGITHIRITSVKAQPLSPALACKSTEVLALKDISDIYHVSTGQDPHEFIIRRSQQGVTLFFSSLVRESIVKVIRTAKSQMKDGQRTLLERAYRAANVPATLLHVGMFSIDHGDEELRSASYELLGAVCDYLEYDKNPVIAPQAGFIPEDPNTFVVHLSERLSRFIPGLTLDFITEICSSMDKAEPPQRIKCLQYMSPWIGNLLKFCDPSSSLYEHSSAKVRDTIRLLVDLAIADLGISPMVQKYVWSEISQLDMLIVNIVLDELMRTAVDGGIGSARCEVAARTVATLSSINVRGRIFSKLRKILGKTSMKPTRSLTENLHWVEIATLTRLAFVAGNHSKQAIHTQLYLPEIVHLVTLIAGTGPTLVRKSVYGIVLNFLQSMYFARGEDEEALDIQSMIAELTQPPALRLFGLARVTASSEYTDFDPINDKVFMESQEALAEILVRVLEVTAGTQGLLNVWRARWMSLITSMVFQYSPAIQSRGFIALGALATEGVDDDLMYQMLVAFKTALAQSNETDTVSVVCMLRCICRVVPALPENSKYFDQLFWLAVALLQSSHAAFYVQATNLMCATVETSHRHGIFQDASLVEVMLDGREALDETLGQLDRLLGLSFDASFSFSLASIIFKGLRHSALKGSAEAALRVLLRVTVETTENPEDASDSSIHPDALGYFLALLPLSTSAETFNRLLQDCDLPIVVDYDDDDILPRVSLDTLGVVDQNTALLLTSFIAAMLTTAQGDDAETEMMYTLLSDVGVLFPDIVSMAYDVLQDRIKETFANSSNANIIKAVSSIFRIALQDPVRLGALRGSASTIGTLDEPNHGPGKVHLLALDELNLRGLASSFQFLPVNRGHATKMITWIPELVTKIIENI